MEQPLTDRLQTLELAKEVRELRETVRTLQHTLNSSLTDNKRKREREPCKALTEKGTPCKHHTVEGSDYCTTHNKPPKQPKPPKRAKSEPKPKNRQVEHSEDPTLRETHGDVLDPALPDEAYTFTDQCESDFSEVLLRYDGFSKMGLDPQAYEENLVAERQAASQRQAAVANLSV